MKSTTNFTILPPDASRGRKTDPHGKKFAIVANEETLEIILRGQDISVPPGAESINYISITVDRTEAIELTWILMEWLKWKQRSIAKQANKLLQQFIGANHEQK